MQRHTLGSICGLFILSFVVSATAAEKAGADKADKDKKKQAVIDPKQADADFGVQGEYSGELDGKDGKVKWGVQVIALGEHKFHAVAYPGGLPGDGWNQKRKIEIDGETKDGRTTFTGDKGSGTVSDGKMLVRDANGNEVGTFERVERISPTLGKKPPEGAVVLFDGTSPKNFKDGRMTEDGLLMQGVTSHQTFQSFSLHLEFLLSYMPYARGQGRGNSGCYMQGRYEVQILDSFGLQGKNNECGGIYEIKDPDLNMCFPPLTWQTYDIDFTAATFDSDGKKQSNARMTVQHNGVVVQQDVEVPRTTRGAKVNEEGSEPGPIYIQDHRNPIRFRNIWLVEKK